MGRRGQAGMTLVELLVIVIVTALLVMLLIPSRSSATDSAKATAMKNRGRGIWICITSANAEREPLGLRPLWPAEQGYSSARTSTEYFRQLMSDSNGVLAVDEAPRVCSDLKPDMLGGAGVPRTESVMAFTCTNNAWVVLCVSNDTPADVPFLVTRNIDWGRQASTSAPVRATRELPFRDKRFVWGSRGGGCFDALPKFAAVLPQSLGTSTLDVMRP